MRRQLWPGLFLLLALLLAGCGGAAPTAPGAAPGQRTIVEGTAEGDRLPDAEFVSLTGERLSVSDLRGKPAIINFWATWCGPCRVEIPQLQATFDQHSPAGLQLVGVTGEDASVVQPFVAEQKMTYPVLFDSDGKAAESFRVQGMPTTFFLDRDGVIVARHVGLLGENVLKVYVDEIMSSAN